MAREGRQPERTKAILGALDLLMASATEAHLLLTERGSDGKSAYEVMSGPELEDALDTLLRVSGYASIMAAPILKWHRVHHIDQDIKSEMRRMKSDQAQAT